MGLERYLSPCVHWKLSRQSVVEEEGGSHRMVTDIVNYIGHIADEQ